MLRIGRDPRATGAFLSAFDAISRGRVFADLPRDEASTTPTSMRAWADAIVRPLLDGDAPCPTRVQYEAA